MSPRDSQGPQRDLDYAVGTVAVPYGNCAEPSNIKARGGHCPIRFQCAGCSFYRPDPSYLPALQNHVAELRVNKERAVATQAPDWAITNLTDQIDAFTGVTRAMTTLLDDLPEENRRSSNRQPKNSGESAKPTPPCKEATSEHRHPHGLKSAHRQAHPGPPRSQPHQDRPHPGDRRASARGGRARHLRPSRPDRELSTWFTYNNTQVAAAIRQAQTDQTENALREVPHPDDRVSAASLRVDLATAPSALQWTTACGHLHGAGAAEM